MNLIFLTILSIIGCSHDNQDDSGDWEQFDSVPSGGSSTTYCYVEETSEQIPHERKK